MRDATTGKTSKRRKTDTDWEALSHLSDADIRAGIALLIAALSANGTSRIANIAQIDRGYEDIEQRLNQLGAHITRVND